MAPFHGDSSIGIFIRNTTEIDLYLFYVTSNALSSLCVLSACLPRTFRKVGQRSYERHPTLHLCIGQQETTAYRRQVWGRRRAIMRFRQGSNERDSSSPTARSNPVMLNAVKHLCPHRERSFAEFTLERSEGLRMTWCNGSNCQGLFFIIEPCLNKIIR